MAVPAMQKPLLTAVPELASFDFASPRAQLTGFELPVAYHELDSGYVYVQIYSFFDNEQLTVQLWERLMRTLNEQNVPGLIIDLRKTAGGMGFWPIKWRPISLDQSLELGNTGRYNAELDGFYFDPRAVDRFSYPQWACGTMASWRSSLDLIAAACASFLLTISLLQHRATVVGQYPTAGLGGSVSPVPYAGRRVVSVYPWAVPWT